MKYTNRFRNYILVVSCLLGLLGACGKKETSEDGTLGEEKKKVLFESDFSSHLNLDAWIVEMDSLPDSRVTVEDGKLVVDTKGGVTVWLKEKLKGNLEITYEREVVMEEGVNDRLSDLNQFWMATDPRDENLFTRRGKFGEYDSLRMYYVGFGGNYNTTTRFRKYHGDGRKELIYDLDDEAHLLQANHVYDIRIRVENGNVQFWVDNELFFDYIDSEPLTGGYFGFRSTWSRHKIDHLKIISLD